MFKYFLALLLISSQIYGQRLELIESFIGYQEDSEIITFTPNKQILFSGITQEILIYGILKNKC